MSTRALFTHHTFFRTFTLPFPRQAFSDAPLYIKHLPLALRDPTPHRVPQLGIGYIDTSVCLPHSLKSTTVHPDSSRSRTSVFASNIHARLQGVSNPPTDN